MARTFDTIYLHEALDGHPRVRQIIARTPHRRLETVSELETVYSALRAGRQSGPGRTARDSLALAPYRGRRVEACPCSKTMRCCLYRVIQLVEGCPYDCSYCVLQGYLNRPLTVIYPELEKAFAELEADLALERPYPPRYGTGELADSLALDRYCGFARPLVQFFAAHPGAWLELKTKSAELGELLDIPHVPRNVVLSWSLNAQSVVKGEERGAASLNARLKAARKAADRGYRLGFHFDPLIRFPGWREQYRETVGRLFRAVRPGETAWISLGSLRYAPWLAPHFAARYEKHPLLAGELLALPPDGKYRYPQPLRVEMYRALYDCIREHDPEVYVYLCLESAAVWRWALGVELGGDELAIERGFPAPPGWAAFHQAEVLLLY